MKTFLIIEDNSSEQWEWYDKPQISVVSAETLELAFEALTLRETISSEVWDASGEMPTLRPLDPVKITAYEVSTEIEDANGKLKAWEQQVIQETSQEILGELDRDPYISKSPLEELREQAEALGMSLVPQGGAKSDDIDAIMDELDKED